MRLFGVIVRDPETGFDEVKATFTESWMAFAYAESKFLDRGRSILSWQALNEKVEATYEGSQSNGDLPGGSDG